jgi:hypothetical protein
MNPSRILGLLLVACLAGLAAPRPSAGQVFIFTLEQYLVLQERTEAFCTYRAELAKSGQQIPKGALSFPGDGAVKWVFSASEVDAFMKRCDQLMALMQKLK